MTDAEATEAVESWNAAIRRGVRLLTGLTDADIDELGGIDD